MHIWIIKKILKSSSTNKKSNKMYIVFSRIFLDKPRLYKINRFHHQHLKSLALFIRAARIEHIQEQRLFWYIWAYPMKSTEVLNTGIDSGRLLGHKSAFVTTCDHNCRSDKITLHSPFASWLWFMIGSVSWIPHLLLFWLLEFNSSCFARKSWNFVVKMM